MPNKKIVLDTNCLLASISRRSTAYPVWKGFQEGRYTPILFRQNCLVMCRNMCHFAASLTKTVTCCSMIGELEENTKFRLRLTEGKN
jgi:hypothetical protein